jgi:hypothetical protein
MAIHRFQGPDGKIHRVEAPTREAAEAEMGRVMGSPSSRARTDMAAKGRATQAGGSFIQGPLLGFADEIGGAVDAVDVAGSNLGRRLTGQPVPYTAGDAYRASRDLFRETEAKERADQPLKSTARTLLGGAMAPGSKLAGGFIAGAKSLPGMMGRSAGVGLGYGSAAGAGNGEDLGGRIRGAAGGGAAGLALGGLIPPAFRVGQKLVTPLAEKAIDAIRPVAVSAAERVAPDMVPQLRPKTPPAPPAELRAARALERAVKRDQASGAAPRKGSLPYQTHGPNVAAVAEVLAQSPGAAQGIIQKAATNSRAGARTGMKTAIAEGMGGRGDYFESLDNLFATRSQAAKDGMSQFGDQLVTLDDNSVSALRSDLSRTAIKDAAANALASPDPDVRNAGAALNRLHDQLLDKPSAISVRVRDAQDISRALLEGSKSAYSSGDGARGAALKGLGKAVRSNAATPDKGGHAEYGAWLKRYGDDSENIEALEMGRNVLTASLDNSPEKIRRTLDEMSDPAKEHFRKGVGEALLTQVQRKGVGAARNLMKDEEFAAKVRLAYPTDDGFNSFMTLADDAVQNEARNVQMLGNSRTDARGEARADLNDEGFDASEMLADIATLNPGGVVRSGARAAIKSLPRRDRSLVGDPKTNSLLGGAVTNQDEMTRLLNLLELDRQRALQSQRPGAYLTAPAAQAPNSR